MFCKNCGSLIDDNNKFCTVCGARLRDEAPSQQPQEQQTWNGQQPQEQQTWNGQQPQEQQTWNGQQIQPDMQQGWDGQIPPVQPAAPKKKGKKAKFIVGGVVAVAAVSTVGVLAASGRLGNFIHKNFTSPESYFKYVAQNNVDDALSSFNTGYTKAVDEFDQISAMNASYSVRVDAGSELKPLLGMIDPSLKDIENATVTVSSSVDGSVSNVKLTANVNEADIATVNATIDMENREGYIQIPELSDSYIDVSDGIDELSDELEYSGTEYKQMVDEVRDVLPEAKTVDKVLNRYIDIPFENITDVDKSSEKIEAEGVSQKVTALTTTLDGGYAYDTACQMLETLKEDDDIKEIIENVDADTYDDFYDSIDEALNEIETYEDVFDSADIQADLTLYVNGKGEIAGTQIDLDAEGQSVVFKSLMPRSGSKFGYEMNVNYTGMKLFSLQGSGTLKHDVMNGTFTVSVADELLEDASDYVSDGDDILTIDVKDFDIADSKDGKLNGSFTFSTDAVRQIKGYQLGLEFSTQKKETSVAVELLYDDESYAKVTLTSAEGGKLNEVRPSGSDTVYSVTDERDMQRYFDEIDIYSFVDDVNDKCGLDIDLDDLGLGDIEDIF